MSTPPERPSVDPEEKPGWPGARSRVSSDATILNELSTGEEETIDKEIREIDRKLESVLLNQVRAARLAELDRLKEKVRTSENASLISGTFTAGLAVGLLSISNAGAFSHFASALITMLLMALLFFVLGICTHLSLNNAQRKHRPEFDPVFTKDELSSATHLDYWRWMISENSWEFARHVVGALLVISMMVFVIQSAAAIAALVR